MKKIIGAIGIIVAIGIAGAYFALSYYGVSVIDTTIKVKDDTNLDKDNQEVNTEVPEKRISFGSDMSSLNYENDGWEPEYISIDAGSWMRRNESSWDFYKDSLEKIKENGTTPVILWRYWGDDTTPEKIQNGFEDKNLDDWERMTKRLRSATDSVMGEERSIVVLEPEFNKHGTGDWSGFDKHLTRMTNILHEGENIDVVIGFGNWGRADWLRFSNSIETADMVGYQGVVKYPENSLTEYSTLPERSVEASKFLQQNFPDKPIIFYDLAISSRHNFENTQKTILGELFERTEVLKDTGTRIVMYRNFVDASKSEDPEDRHFGLINENGIKKPAYSEWINGVTTGGV